MKMRCAFKRCRRNVDVKNAGAERQLKCQEVNMVMCRAVRKHCKTIRFCCKDHLKQCKSGGKEALTQNQCITLIQTLLVICPWAAVLSLLQLFIIDRADCARSCRWGWLSGMEPDSKRQASITIPKVNGKTIPRTIPIYQPFAALLWKTIHGNPIEAPAVRCGQQQGKMWTHQSHLCFQALKQMAKPEIGTNPFVSVRIWHVSSKQQKFYVHKELWRKQAMLPMLSMILI